MKPPSSRLIKQMMVHYGILRSQEICGGSSSYIHMGESLGGIS